MSETDRYILNRCKRDPKFAKYYTFYDQALNSALCLFKFRTRVMHMTQAQLAKKVNIPRSTISKIESGDMTLSSALLQKITKSCHKPFTDTNN